MSAEKRAEHIQLDLIQNAKDLGARNPRSTVHAEMKSYGIEGRFIALAVGRFGEFSGDFVKMRDYIAREKTYAYNEHFNSSVNMAMSMFKLSFTSRWALMAARGWARLILDRRRDLIAIAQTALLQQGPRRMKPRSATTSTSPRHAHTAHINAAKQHSAFALPYTLWPMN